MRDEKIMDRRFLITRNVTKTSLQIYRFEVRSFGERVVAHTFVITIERPTISDWSHFNQSACPSSYTEESKRLYMHTLSFAPCFKWSLATRSPTTMQSYEQRKMQGILVLRLRNLNGFKARLARCVIKEHGIRWGLSGIRSRGKFPPTDIISWKTRRERKAYFISSLEVPILTMGRLFWNQHISLLLSVISQFQKTG